MSLRWNVMEEQQLPHWPSAALTVSVAFITKLYKWLIVITSRERHKSAPYLRLKIVKGHESVKKLKVSNSQKEYQTHDKPKRRKWHAKRRILSHFSTSIVVKHQKSEGGPFDEKNPKSLSMPKNWKGDPSEFFNIPSVAKHQKIEGGPFGDFFRKKSHNAEKNKGRTL